MPNMLRGRSNRHGGLTTRGWLPTSRQAAFFSQAPQASTVGAADSGRTADSVMAKEAVEKACSTRPVQVQRATSAASAALACASSASSCCTRWRKSRFGAGLGMVRVVVARGMVQPVKPLAHALARGGRELDDLYGRVHAPRQLDAAGHVKLHMRQQVDLVEDHQLRRGKHVGVLERFVFAFGDRQDGHFGRLAQVPHGGAHQVADVFDEQQAVIGVGVPWSWSPP
jgi:hypothetical protein